MSNQPLVTCIVPTRPSRKVFWPIVFRCFQNQIWPNKELLLINEEKEILPPGVRQIIVPENTSIGEKLNIGVENSKANFFHKWDDDDWYGPQFLERLIRPFFSKQIGVLSLLGSHLVFLLDDWELRATGAGTLGGGTICFDRKAWEERKFEPISFGEDSRFYENRDKLYCISDCPLNYVLVRHYNNTWAKWSDGKSVENIFLERGEPLIGGPEKFFPLEDLKVYQQIRDRG